MIVKGIRCSLRFIASSMLRMAGLWFARHEQLELREELEEVLAHEARRDLVAAGEVLELRLGPALALFGFDGATKRAPRRPAISVGCRSVRVSMKVSIGALVA